MMPNSCWTSDCGSVRTDSSFRIILLLHAAVALLVITHYSRPIHWLLIRVDFDFITFDSLLSLSSLSSYVCVNRCYKYFSIDNNFPQSSCKLNGHTRAGIFNDNVR